MPVFVCVCVCTCVCVCGYVRFCGERSYFLSSLQERERESENEREIMNTRVIGEKDDSNLIFFSLSEREMNTRVEDKDDFNLIFFFFFFSEREVYTRAEEKDDLSVRYFPLYFSPSFLSTGFLSFPWH